MRQEIAWTPPFPFIGGKDKSKRFCFPPLGGRISWPHPFPSNGGGDLLDLSIFLYGGNLLDKSISGGLCYIESGSGWPCADFISAAGGRGGIGEVQFSCEAEAGIQNDVVLG